MKNCKSLIAIIVASLAAVFCGDLAMAAGAKQLPEWDKTVKAAK